jgi:hypothetical protein
MNLLEKLPVEPELLGDAIIPTDQLPYEGLIGGGVAILEMMQQSVYQGNGDRILELILGLDQVFQELARRLVPEESMETSVGNEGALVSTRCKEF